MSNCPRCQIILFALLVSNCPTCPYGVKLSEVSNCLRCQIVLGVKLSYNQEYWLLNCFPRFHEIANLHSFSRFSKLFGFIFHNLDWSWVGVCAFQRTCEYPFLFGHHINKHPPQPLFIQLFILFGLSANVYAKFWWNDFITEKVLWLLFHLEYWRVWEDHE